MMAGPQEGGGGTTASNPPVTYQAWSRSFVEMYSITHEWTIENFIELDEEATVIFRVNAIEGLPFNPNHPQQPTAGAGAVSNEASASAARTSSGGSSAATLNAAANARASTVVSNTGADDLKFKLSLKPKYGENRDYISLYVHNLNKKDLKYSLVFNILDVNKERKIVRRADMRVHSPNESWGFPKFCQRSEVTDSASEMLPEGTLTVVCEIGGFKRLSSRSDYQRVRDNFDREVFPDLSRDLTDAFLAMEHSDMVLKCKRAEGDSTGEAGSAVSYPCHKFMLASRSDVFRAMFSHSDLREAVTGEVDLTDSAPAHVVREFLSFVYTDTFADTSFKTVSLLLPLAEKYNVKRLCIECGQHLLAAMSIDNASEIAVIGQLYRVDLLKHKAIEFISQYPEKVIRTPGWGLLLKEAPEVCTAIICRLSGSPGADKISNSMTGNDAANPDSGSGGRGAVRR